MGLEGGSGPIPEVLVRSVCLVHVAPSPIPANLAKAEQSPTHGEGGCRACVLQRVGQQGALSSLLLRWQCSGGVRVCMSQGWVIRNTTLNTNTSILHVFYSMAKVHTKYFNPPPQNSPFQHCDMVPFGTFLPGHYV